MKHRRIALLAVLAVWLGLWAINPSAETPVHKVEPGLDETEQLPAPEVVASVEETESDQSADKEDAPGQSERMTASEEPAAICAGEGDPLPCNVPPYGPPCTVPSDCRQYCGAPPPIAKCSTFGCCICL